MLLCTPAGAQAYEPADVVGTVPRTLSSWSGKGAQSDESMLGDAAADAVRMATGAEAAIVNGGDIRDNAIQAGAQSWQAILDAFSENRPIAVCETTPKTLYALLESGVAHIVTDAESGELLHEQSAFGGFPQVAGITFRYDAAASPGSRILWIRLDGAGALDPNDEATKLKVAGTAFFLSGGYGGPKLEDYETLDMTLADAMAMYVASGIETEYGRVDRMSVAGGRADTIISQIPAGAVAAVVAVLGLLGAVRQRRRRQAGVRNWDERYDDKDDRPLM